MGSAEFRSGNKRSESFFVRKCWSCLSAREPHSRGRAERWCRRQYGISSPGPVGNNEWLLFFARLRRRRKMSVRCKLSAAVILGAALFME
jgi:hypothetical protein